MSSRRRPPPLPVRHGLNPSRVRVEGPEVGHTSVLDFLLERLADMYVPPEESLREALLRRFAAEEILTPTGEILQPTSPPHRGLDIYFYREAAPEVANPFTIPVIYQDERIVVADKPPFMATMPRGGHITETLVVKLRQRLNLPELTPAHRLDRHPSGLVLFPTTPPYRGTDHDLFSQRQVEKTYRAHGHGSPQITAGMMIRNRMIKTFGILQAEVVPGEVNAITHITAVEPQPDGTAVYELSPATGRTHQLRRHLSDLGGAILGDPLYPTVTPAAPETDFSTPLRLVATRLAFTDPITGEQHCFTSPRDPRRPTVVN